MSKLFFIFLIFTVLVLTGFKHAEIQNDSIILKDEQVPVTPKEFYIENVIDERGDKNGILWYASILGQSATAIGKPYDFAGGGFVAIKRFINHNLPKNKALRPVIIRLKQFKAGELVLEDGHVSGDVSTVMSFSLLREDGDTIHLVDYNGKIQYTRSGGPVQDAEPTLRHSLANALIYLNTWMNKQAATNINLAKTVKVTFTDYTEKTEGDTVYYSFTRPLTWADFHGKVPQSRFDAEVFATIGYNEKATVINGAINLELDIKVCIPKNDCWVKAGMQNDYALNHEQRHFDIARIVAEHFKRRIRAEYLPVSNYDGPVNVDYLDAYREMDSLQKQYDEETNHGGDHAAQERWNERIDRELKTFKR
ncbi:hypothetical protein [Mucilaginibacter gotjawali]|uniref:Uncharacterized protein n=2 Tax=Mucilaginibacter gotjawali TaxID=1550579 RepID=A0A839SK21_9SPHI|nr:hypothetical protein [Mucilaginibacter gotjawali]MBB3056879.1 hypothetical protein [Mucilaginibacter gotjawali]BAU55959.1 hypothetical protein MgSA37_04151 [Mucilaginibacter gotjawali]